MNQEFIIIPGASNMPELPEVETVRRTLETLIVGKTIRDIDVFYERIIRGSTVTDFISKLEGQTLSSIDRYGKYLIFIFGELTILSHLRMEGKYFIKNLDEPKEKHEHIIFYFTDGSTLRYHDTRKFGTMDLILTKDIFTNSPIIKQGYEPFNEKLTGTHLRSLLKNRKTAIKSALLDQTVMSGLGNIYVDEVLFLSKLDPERQANTLTLKQYKDVVTNAKKVLTKAVELGGTTIRSYTSSLGVTGRFQNELLVHMKEKEPCIICLKPITKIKVNGRGTYYCTNCQK